MTAWIAAKRKQRGAVSTAGVGHAPDPRAEIERQVQERTAELRRALEAAQQADLAKDAFLANVSHELRTPLGAVTALSALALEHAEDARQRDYLEKIGNAGKHLSRIINDLLDLSKIVAGRMEFETIPFSLRAMIRHAHDVMTCKAEAKGLRLGFRIRDQVPDILLGDPLRLEQILLNLLGNAIKFTASGGVEVRIAHVASANDRIWLAIDVEDSGVGMRPEDVAGLFRPFSQADVSMSRKYGGTGLGLALSQHLAQMMDGGISVSSREKIGSTFSLRVRLGVGSSASPKLENAGDLQHAARPRFDRARVLVVEDDPINIEIVGELLGSAGIVPRLASNGQEALDILAAAGPDGFDLVLMDIQMPVMDGLTATRRIRDWPGFDKLPIAAMTAHALEHERQIGVAAGMSDHVVKPFDLDGFYQVLSKWLPDRTMPSGSRAAADVRAVPGLAALNGVDTVGALRRFLGNEERYRHWLIKFVEESPAVTAQIREALAAGQADLATRTAHSFKGGVGAIGLCELQERAAALEAALKTRREAEPELQSLERSIEAARAEIIAALGF